MSGYFSWDTGWVCQHICTSFLFSSKEYGIFIVTQTTIKLLDVVKKLSNCI